MRDRGFEPAFSQDVGAPSAVVPGSRAQAQGHESLPALDSSAVVGAEGERASAREQSSLCGGAPKGAGAEPPKESVAGPEDPGGGESNTTPQTPADALGMLQYGVDALHVAYRIEPNPRLLPTLDGLLPENRFTAAYEVKGARFELKRAGKRFALSNADTTIVVGRDKAGFNMVFEARAMLLRRKTLSEVLQLALDLVETIAVAKVLEAKLRRIDIFKDVGGVAFGSEDMENFVSRARKQAEFHVPEKVYHVKAEGEVRATGFWFSPGNPIQVRLYDKFEELEVVSGKDSSKTRTELFTYRCAGWDGESRVWRVEAQLRGAALKRLKVVRPEQLGTRLWHLWDYCFGSEKAWLRLIVPDSSTRRERGGLDPRWQVFAQNPFQDTGEVVKPEPGNLGGTSPEQLMGNFWSMLSARGLLKDLDPHTSRDEMLQIDLLEAEMVLISTLKKSDRELLKDRAAVIAKYATLDDAEYFRSNFEDWPEDDE